MRTAMLLLVLASASTLGACRRHVVVHETPRGDVVVIERGHIHSHHCGHYFHRGHWYVAHGHVHAHGCGHVHRDGIWVVLD
jgi:hypothetical protein